MTDTAATPGPALHLSGLVKRFGEKTAVAGVDLVVPQGSFFGLVGPNGAGKTTTLSMATGLLRPDAGSAWVQIRDGRKDTLFDAINDIDIIALAQDMQRPG